MSFTRSSSIIKGTSPTVTSLRSRAIAICTQNVSGQQRQELFKEALDQIRNQVGGSLDAVIAVIEQFTRGEKIDRERLAKAMQFMPEALRIVEERIRSFGKGAAGTSLAGEIYARMKEAGVTFGEGPRLLTEQELMRAENLFRQIEKAAERQEKAAEALETAAENAASMPPSQTFNTYKPKYFGPDARSQQQRIMNGQTRARRLGT
jgi:hypothetical protein